MVPPLTSHPVRLLPPHAQAALGAAATYARAIGVNQLPQVRRQGSMIRKIQAQMATQQRRRRLGARQQARQLRPPANPRRRFRGVQSTASASPTSLVMRTSNPATRTATRQLSAIYDPRWATTTPSDPILRLLDYAVQTNMGSITIIRAAGFRAALLQSLSRALGSRSAHPV
jgi:hypothetical protein